MGDDDLALLLNYPLILCATRNSKKHYKGVIRCGNRDLNLYIVQKTANGDVHFKLKTVFGTETDEAITRIKATSICVFLDQVRAIFEKKTQTVPKNLVTGYRRVLHEYSEFTGFHLNIKTSKLSVDMSKIDISTIDDGGREHFLEIAVNFEEIKEIFCPLNLNLPEQFVKDFLVKFSNLTEIYSKFLAIIDELQPFFDVMGELDANCCVLDPEKPTWRDCHRRIWLDHTLSMIVMVDPLNAHARPELKFLGPERLVDPYLQKLGDRLEDWDSTELLQELLNILGLEAFPSKPSKDHEMLMEVGECSICFSLRLNDKLPEVICSNKSCENCYHIDCLYEWLTSVNSKRIFNQIHGQCPNCEKGISCPLPDVT